MKYSTTFNRSYNEISEKAPKFQRRYPIHFQTDDVGRTNTWGASRKLRQMAPWNAFTSSYQSNTLFTVHFLYYSFVVSFFSQFSEADIYFPSQLSKYPIRVVAKIFDSSVLFFGAPARVAPVTVSLSGVNNRTFSIRRLRLPLYHWLPRRRSPERTVLSLRIRRKRVFMTGTGKPKNIGEALASGHSEWGHTNREKNPRP